MRPYIWIVAGPNGAGKTTLTSLYLGSRIPIINPDVIQRELSGGVYRGSLNMLAAGRLALQMRQQFMDRLESFAMETTLTGKNNLHFIKQATELGYKTNLVFVGIRSVEDSSSRIENRVLEGGHDVPLEDQLRRFDRSLANMAAALPLVDRALIFDNSGKRRRLLISIENGRIKYAASAIPGWAIRTIPPKYRSTPPADVNNN